YAMTMVLTSPGLNFSLNPSLAQRLLDAEFHRVFSNRGIALGDDDDLAVDVGALLGERVDDLVVNVVPAFPRHGLHLYPPLVESPFPLDDFPAAARAGCPAAGSFRARASSGSFSRTCAGPARLTRGGRFGFGQ